MNIIANIFTTLLLVILAGSAAAAQGIRITEVLASNGRAGYDERN